MSFLKTIYNRLKSVKAKTEERITLPSPEKLGYFNGECPECKAHIGVYVWLEYYGRVRRYKKKAAYCPCCGKEIFGKIEKWEEGRI